MLQVFRSSMRLHSLTSKAPIALNENFRVSVGGRNIFDEFPDEIDRTVNDNDYCCGRVYASGSIVPWQGGYWYLRFNADFF